MVKKNHYWCLSRVCHLTLSYVEQVGLFLVPTCIATRLEMNSTRSHTVKEQIFKTSEREDTQQSIFHYPRESLVRSELCRTLHEYMVQDRNAAPLYLALPEGWLWVQSHQCEDLGSTWVAGKQVWGAGCYNYSLEQPAAWCSKSLGFPGRCSSLPITWKAEFAFILCTDSPKPWIVHCPGNPRASQWLSDNPESCIRPPVWKH